jgi:hypothetical protein
LPVGGKTSSGPSRAVQARPGATTGIDMDALLEAGHLAETIIGRRLPGSLLRSGSLARFRRNAA